MAGGTGASDPVALRPAGPSDVAAVAALHARMIDEGFLSSLGERFLRRLYRRILLHPGSVLIVADDAGAVAGFVAGSRQVGGLFATFARRDAPAAVAGSPWGVLRSWRRVLETRRLGGGSSRAESADAELLAIAVDESHHGRGVGGRLVTGLLSALADAGARTVDVVVGSDNEAAIALYRRSGFSPVRSLEVHAGTSSLLLRHDALAAGGAGGGMMRLLAAGAGGLVLALVCVPVAMAVARRAGIVDRPGELKPQDWAVPYLGGAAVFVAALPGLALSRPALVGPLGGALLLGVLDDWRGVPPRWRLVGEVAVGAGVAAAVPTRLTTPLGWVAVVAVTVVLMNGVNMIDGLDGLAGGVVALSAGAAALLLAGAVRTAAVGMAGALVGFLLYNRPPARVYLGDGGAYLLGAWLAIVLAWSWGPGTTTAKSVAALLLVAVPAAEVAFAVARRLGGRVPLAEGDRRHPYDLLVARGWSAGRAASSYVALEALLCALAVGAGAARNLGLAVAAAVAAAVVLVALAGATGTFHRPGRLAR